MKKSLFKKIRCCVRKYFSVAVIPYIPLNGLRVAMYRMCGYKIGKNVFIGMRCYLDDLEPKMFTVEDNVTISYGCFFACHGYKQEHTPITLRGGAYLGMRCTVVSGKNGVTIGEKAVIGACSLIISDIPNNVTAVGSPCKPIIPKQTITEEAVEDNNSES
jgi:acetyltransferase-like isoleucine patch superfamily enzyme